MLRHPLMPSDTPIYMAEAWEACMNYAANNQEIVSKFCQDTGKQWTPEKSDCVDAFIKWANVHVWGPIDGKTPLGTAP